MLHPQVDPYPDDTLIAPVDVLPRWLEAMMRGDFEAAWAQTDRIELPRRRHQASGDFTRQDYHLVWNGAPFANQRVLVRCEHGLGDTIQFLRYIPRLRAEAREVIVKVQPMLLTLFEGMPGIDMLRNAWTTDPDPEHDVAIECMEFPYAFRDTPASLPHRVPYLPVERIRTAANRLPVEWQWPAGMKVGVIWASSAWDSSRSVSLSRLAPLATLDHVYFFSLQQGPEQSEIDSAPFPISSLSQYTMEIREAAAAMLEMDLIITVDSMTAHLAGALGRPVWVLLQHRADWRWMAERDDSPWYPTMRLFRQPTPGDWDSPIREMTGELRRLSSVGSCA